MCPILETTKKKFFHGNKVASNALPVNKFFILNRRHAAVSFLQPFSSKAFKQWLA